MASTLQAAQEQVVAVPVETIGQRLRRSRLKANLKTSEMARALEVSDGMVSRWENDKETPKRHIRLAYAQLCAVPFEWLDEAVSGTTPQYSDTGSTREYCSRRRHLRLVKLKDVA